jgi:Fe2+ transport system protein B
MAKKSIKLLIQAILTLVVGLLLLNMGLPHSPKKIVLKTSEFMATTAAEQAPEEIGGTTTSVLGIIHILGAVLSVVSIIQLAYLLISFIITSIIDFSRSQKRS